MTQPTIIERAIGNGNCCFNAFILGLANPVVLNNVNLKTPAGPGFERFMTDVATAFGIGSTWQDLAAYLQSNQSTEFRHTLQVKLAPLMRKLAIDTIRIDPTSHQESSLQALQAEFANYCSQQNEITQDNRAYDLIGDIFIRHPFIRAKFEELSNEPWSESTLTDWWETQGHNEFLTQMSISADNASQSEYYAGDLELKPLGTVFGVNIRVITNHYTTQINNENAPIPATLYNDAETLADRGIIQSKKDFSWRSLTTEELTKRLSAIPQLDKVESYSKTTKSNADEPVPADWNTECIDELRQRSLVVTRAGRRVFSQTLTPAILERCKELPTKATVLNAWKETYRLIPVITLENDHGVHWNTVTPEHISAYQDKLTPTAAKKSYQASHVEAEVNDAVNKAFDLLDHSRSSFEDDDVAAKFEAVFKQFSEVLQHYNTNQDLTLFKNEKEKILTSVRDEITVAKNRSKL